MANPRANAPERPYSFIVFSGNNRYLRSGQLVAGYAVAVAAGALVLVAASLLGAQGLAPDLGALLAVALVAHVISAQVSSIKAATSPRTTATEAWSSRAHADALAAAAEAFGAGTDVRAILRAITRAALPALRADSIALWLVDESSMVLRRVAQAPPGSGGIIVEMMPLADPDVRALLTQGTVSTMSEADGEADVRVAAAFGARSLLAVPLNRGDHPIGLLTVSSAVPRRDWTADDVTTACTLGLHSAVALERAELAAETAHQSVHDALTGLPNRALLDDRLRQATLLGGREARPFALLLINLDRFKDVNDALGRRGGDDLLRGIAERLRLGLRASDSVARLGGDEFALLLPSVDGMRAMLLADRLLERLQAPFTLGERDVTIGATIGIALFPEHGDDPERLLRRADAAMHRAKEAHSGYTLYRLEDERDNSDQLVLAGALRNAIAHDELELYYQPKIACQGRHVVGAEALVRWNHPQLGTVQPGRFIYLAEQTGSIRSLTRWVLGESVRQIRAWQDTGRPISVAVNLSTHDLIDAHLPDYIAGELDRYGLSASYLKLEITESAVMSEPEQAVKVITRLHALGLEIALDDFGTGYSSLAHLQRLHVQDLKIDCSFVQHMADNPRDQTIVHATIELAHRLGMAVIAEGVEDRVTLDLLSELSCDVAQGYHFSRPIPAADFVRWCAEWEASVLHAV